jgi:hypothetical protein
MGQYGNQPDFGVTALSTAPQGDSADPTTAGTNLKGAALYVGTGGDLLVTLTGGDEGSGFDGATFFVGVPSGSFLPIVVDYVWLENNSVNLTTADNIIALY